MLERLKRRPIEGYNKIWLGAIGVVLVAVVVAGIVGLGRFSPGHTRYQGEFAQAAQIRAGDQVSVAGINVGKVSSVTLAGDHVTVDFTVRDGVRLGEQTHAAIKLSTLLGRRYVELSPAGDGELDDNTITLANTSVPYDLQDTLAGATTTFGQVDADRIATSMSELSKGLVGVPEALPQALQNIESLANVVTKRRDQIGALLKNVDTVTGVIRDQKADLGSLVLQGGDLLQTVVSRQAAIHRLFDGTTAMVDTLNRVLADEPAMSALLEDLEEFGGMAAGRDELIRNTLQVMPVTFRNLANATGTGNAIDINLPAGMLIDSWMCAISERGEQFNLAKYFTDCQPTADPFPGWPPPDPARAPR